jgi:hypothetical protein
VDLLRLLVESVRGGHVVPRRGRGVAEEVNQILCRIPLVRLLSWAAEGVGPEHVVEEIGRAGQPRERLGAVPPWR